MNLLSSAGSHDWEVLCCIGLTEIVESRFAGAEDKDDC